MFRIREIRYDTILHTIQYKVHLNFSQNLFTIELQNQVNKPNLKGH